MECGGSAVAFPKKPALQTRPARSASQPSPCAPAFLCVLCVKSLILSGDQASKRKPRLQINLPIRRPRRIRPTRQRIRHPKKSRKRRRRRIRSRRTQHRARRSQIHIIKNVPRIHTQSQTIPLRCPRPATPGPTTATKRIPSSTSTAASAVRQIPQDLRLVRHRHSALYSPAQIQKSSTTARSK